jgi:hypothetical protein
MKGQPLEIIKEEKPNPVASKDDAQTKLPSVVNKSQ